jgi:hypothetical protein
VAQELSPKTKSYRYSEEFQQIIPAFPASWWPPGWWGGSIWEKFPNLAGWYYLLNTPHGPIPCISYICYQTTARGPDAAHCTSSCVPFNVSVTNVRLGPILGNGRSARTPRAPQFCITVFVSFCSLNLILLSLSSIFGRTVVSTTVTKSRYLRPPVSGHFTYIHFTYISFHLPSPLPNTISSIPFHLCYNGQNCILVFYIGQNRILAFYLHAQSCYM